MAEEQNYHAPATAFFSGPTLDLFGCEQMSSSDQHAIIRHTLAVIHHLEGMQRSALSMSEHLSILRDTYHEKGSAETWTEYCKRNFEHFGLSESAIRTAVRTGKAVSRLRSRGHQNVDELANLSRAALFAFSDAPVEIQARVLDEVVESIHDGRTPTTKDVKGKIEEVLKELGEKDDIIREKDVALLRMNNLLKAREEEAAGTREEIDRLQRKISLQAQVVVHQLPPGVKDAQEMKERLQEEISEKRDDLMKIESSLAKIREEQQRVEQQARSRALAQNALDSLEGDIKAMSLKYAGALVEKIRNADRNNSQKLDHLSNMLRAMADQLSSALL